MPRAAKLWKVPVEVRFWLRVDKRGDGECWPWLGAPNRKGYGIIHTGVQNTGAHRVSWEMANGRPVPDGLWVLHSCDNRLCVNPAHLRVGTNDDNVRDRVQRGRTKTGRRKQCPNGHVYTPETLLLRKSGLRLCRICKAASSRKYYERNAKRVCERTRAWRQRNRDKVNSYSRAHAAADRERERARSRRWGMLAREKARLAKLLFQRAA